MIQPFEYCKNCGLVYAHIQNFECVVCRGELESIEGLNISDTVAKNLHKPLVIKSVCPHIERDKNLKCTDCGDQAIRLSEVVKGQTVL